MPPIQSVNKNPKALTEAVNVNPEVALTIELGVTINLNNYCIRIKGTIQAVGSSFRTNPPLT